MRWFLVWFPILFLVSLGLLRMTAPAAYDRTVDEDGPVEYATSLVYLLCCLAAGRLALQGYAGAAKFRVLFGVLSLAFLFVCLEEISWGQRLFGIPTPKFLAHNVQGELTLHNLPGIEKQLLHPLYILTGFLGAFSRLLLPRKVPQRNRRTVDLLVPPLFLFFYFVPCFVFYLAGEIIHPYSEGAVPDFLRGVAGIPPPDDQEIPPYWGHQEPVELLLSLGFLLFLWRQPRQLKEGAR